MPVRDEDAFRDFVVGRSPSYLRTAYLLTGDWGHAEDLLQTSLAKVYRQWARLADRENLDAYVRRVMVNTQTSRWRRAWRAERPTASVPDSAAPDAVGASDDRDRLRRALLTLPARQRAVVVLRHYEDMSEADVATTLGCSVGTVKSQCARGLARLREALEENALREVRS
ncbi:MAG TPA: SigE family RNA polymerase sigma factor [Frankiaceae bacterium]|nr:SigE family RNA polymerase sigma factor [Frankiaceae bacterium]